MLGDFDGRGCLGKCLRGYLAGIGAWKRCFLGSAVVVGGMVVVVVVVVVELATVGESTALISVASVIIVASWLTPQGYRQQLEVWWGNLGLGLLFKDYLMIGCVSGALGAPELALSYSPHGDGHLLGLFGVFAGQSSFILGTRITPWGHTSGHGDSQGGCVYTQMLQSDHIGSCAATTCMSHLVQPTIA